MEAAIGDHPDGGWGWVIVFASFLGFFISAGLLNSFSVIYVAFLDAFKESKAVTAWISGIFDVAFTFSASYGVAFSKRFGHRKAVMAAGVLASLGILTSGFTTHVYQLFFTYGVLTGAGMGVVYVTCIEIVSIYFKKRFPIAIGLASAGAGAGQFVLSLVTQMMVDQYGWRGMLLFMSAFTLHLCVAGALMRPLRARQLPTKHRSPDKDLQRSQKDDECNKKIYSSEENHSKAEESAESYDMITVKDKTVDRKPKKTFARRCKSYFLSIYDVTLFQEPVFITICIIGVGQVFGINSASIHLVRRARDFGISYNFGSYIPAVMGLVQLIARPCFGAAGHIRCLGPSVTFAVAIFACGISLIISIYAISFTSPVQNNGDISCQNKKSRKKRGSRGGIRARLRKRGSRYPLPTITFSNVRSLQNKMDELTALVRFDGDFRRNNLLCFSETWLTEEADNISLPGYSLVRADRNPNKAKKRCGGGLCAFVSNRWATQFNIHEQVCTHDYELLSVSFRPFYLPREFSKLTVIMVYVPGPNFKIAGEKISEVYSEVITRSPDNPVFIVGDFNRCDMTSHLPNLYQYVTVPTRLGRTIDMCYRNIPDAYRSIGRPALGRSDHNVVHLLPKYRQKLKTEKPQVKTIQVWSPESIGDLQNCFEITDWDIFKTSCVEPQELVDTVSCYMKFCENIVVKTKSVRVFPNNKPWVTKEMKMFLNEKKLAFLQGDRSKYKEKEKEFRQQARIAKYKYRMKVEEKLKTNNCKAAWDGLKVMMGKKQNTSLNSFPRDLLAFPDELNKFYARFDVRDFTNECVTLCQSLKPVSDQIEVSQSDVEGSFLKLNSNKAAAPDKITGRVLKNCA
ncbi:uncharacterized protein [Ptychodera flava]|uniref:uncharacterized protein isoform X1 n=1 Tax=Ptychodera flava TaxID=63121 RepID=UPI00396A77E3